MIQKIRDIVAHAQARRLYSGMVRKCERMHGDSSKKAQICVITHPVHRDKLLYIDRGGLSRLLRSMPLRKGSKVDFKTVRDGSWYFTARCDGKGGMSAEQKEARRRLFIDSYVRSDTQRMLKMLRKGRRKRRIEGYKAKIREIFSKSEFKGRIRKFFTKSGDKIGNIQ